MTRRENRHKNKISDLIQNVKQQSQEKKEMREQLENEIQQLEAERNSIISKYEDEHKKVNDLIAKKEQLQNRC